MMMMKCSLHPKNNIEYFCQTCLDAICLDCRNFNPHSGQYHNVKSLQQSVLVRKQQFQKYVTEQLNPIRIQISRRLAQLKKVQQNQLTERSVIAKDVQLEFLNIYSRTQEKTEKCKLNFLTEIKHKQSFLNCLDDLSMTFEQTAQDPYNFLTLYHEFIKKIQHLESKSLFPFAKDQQKHHHESQQNQQQQQQISESKIIHQEENEGKKPMTETPKLFTSVLIKSKQTQQPTTTPTTTLQKILNHIPRQAAQTKLLLNSLTEYTQRNQLLNNLITKSTQQYQTKTKNVKSQGIQKYKSILHKYNSINQEILSYKAAKTCVFCEQSFSIEATNGQCFQNKSMKTKVSQNYSHVQHIGSQFLGTKMHYWVDSALQNRKIPTMDQHALTRIMVKKEFFNSLKDLAIVKTYLSRFQIQTGKNFMQPFAQADKQKLKYLSKINFKYILTKIFNMQETHSQFLTNLISHKFEEPPVQAHQHQQSQSLLIKQEQNKKSLQNQLATIQQQQPLQSSQQHKIIYQQKQFIPPAGFIQYEKLKNIIDNPMQSYNKFILTEQLIQAAKPVAPKSFSRKYRY